jgi:hypothetical protein
VKSDAAPAPAPAPLGGGGTSDTYEPPPGRKPDEPDATDRNCQPGCVNCVNMADVHSAALTS